MKRIYAIERWCVDCKLCEVACKTAHSNHKDPVRAFLLEGDDLRSRVRVEGDLDLSVAVNCRQCAQPVCVDGCISGAMTRDASTGLVSCDTAKCVGCGTCMTLCPVGCVEVVPVAGRAVALKCDLCADDVDGTGVPRCVAACPNRALIYVESEVVA